jgi:hypothetical protein
MQIERFSHPFRLRQGKLHMRGWMCKSQAWKIVIDPKRAVILMLKGELQEEIYISVSCYLIILAGVSTFD